MDKVGRILVEPAEILLDGPLVVMVRRVMVA